MLWFTVFARSQAIRTSPPASHPRKQIDTSWNFGRLVSLAMRAVFRFSLIGDCLSFGS